MLIPDFIFSFFIALTVSFIASLFIRKKGPRKGFWIFFLLIFLGTWAGGVWLRHMGMQWMMGSWLPFLLSGVSAAFIFTLLVPDVTHVQRGAVLDRKETLEILEEVEQQKEVKEAMYISINIVFWIVVFLLLAAITMKYI